MNFSFILYFFSFQLLVSNLGITWRLPKICWINFQLLWVIIKLNSLRRKNGKILFWEKKWISLGGWCPLPRNLSSVSYSVGTAIWLCYKTDWKKAQIRLTGNSSQQWLQKLQLTAWALSNHIQGVLFLKRIKNILTIFILEEFWIIPYATV